MLGAIGFTRAIPLILLSPVGGALADRLDKRLILYVSQAVQMVSATLLGILTSLHLVRVWHVITLAGVAGAALAFDNPARQALLPRLVSKQEMHRAISLNAIAFNGAAVFGPSLTGLLVPMVGLAGCFFINAVTFLAVFLALAVIRIPPSPAVRCQQSMWQDVREGMAYMVRRPIILALISMGAVTSFFGRPFLQFITVYARDILRGGVGLAGLMQAAPSLGTILFMTAVAGLRDIRWKGKLLVGASVGFSLSLIGFAWSRNVWLSLLLLVLAGGFVMTWQTTLNTLIQSNVEDGVRGRVMAFYTITALALMPFGQGPMGIAVERLGPPLALTLGAVIPLVFVLYMSLVRVKSIWLLP